MLTEIERLLEAEVDRAGPRPASERTEGLGSEAVQRFRGGGVACTFAQRSEGCPLEAERRVFDQGGVAGQERELPRAPQLVEELVDEGGLAAAVAASDEEVATRVGDAHGGGADLAHPPDEDALVRSSRGFGLHEGVLG